MSVDNLNFWMRDERGTDPEGISRTMEIANTVLNLLGEGYEIRIGKIVVPSDRDELTRTLDFVKKRRCSLRRPFGTKPIIRLCEDPREVVLPAYFPRLRASAEMIEIVEPTIPTTVGNAITVLRDPVPSRLTGYLVNNDPSLNPKVTEYLQNQGIHPRTPKDFGLQ